MTVASTQTSISYPASSVIAGTPLAVPFTVQAVDELAVYTGERFTERATLGVDYLVTLAPPAFATATVTPTLALGGFAVVIERDTDSRQSLVIQLGERLPERAITRELDRGALRDQELSGRVGRALTVPANETGAVLPAAADRQNTLLAFDADGEPYAVDFTAGFVLIAQEF